ncbi:phage tail tape measure protein [Streptomyces sp. NPDC057217]|uniref:phage tail tape measure protein n=1 Tax=Streptomyces sp. NPDC057217 TaxID=3346054 RepID=UPI0036385C52
MALTVGELLATISVDDAPARAGMQRTETAMQQTGDTIVAEADRAGAEAGQALADGVEEGAQQGAEGGGGAFAAFGWAAVGAAAGAALMVGISSAMEQGQVKANLAAQLGATGPEAAKYGAVAGDLYAGAIVESVEQGAEIIKGIARGGLLPPEATESQMKALGTKVADTATVMGEDVSKVTRAVGTMMKNGLADSAEEALDVLVKGSQNGVDVAEDLLDTFAEYPTQFRDLGLSAEMAMGLMQQGLQGGARDADTVADGLKEFAIRAKDMSEGSVEAFKAIGLNAEEMATTFTNGGPKAASALDTVLTRIKAIKDPAERNAVAVGLFGTKAEDMQKALMSMDPSTAVAALGKVKGATDAAGNTMRDTAAHRFEAFKRGLTQGVVEVIGTHVVPALMTGADYVVKFGEGMAAAGKYVADNKTTFAAIGTVITVIILPALVQWAVQQAITGAAVVSGWVTTGAASVTSAATQVASAWATVGGWAAMAGRAIWAGAIVVGQWVLMGAQAMMQAARMAAAWLIAMGPIGLVIAAVVALVVLVIKYWDDIVAFTKKAWDWVWEKLKEIGQAIVEFFLNWTLPGLIIKHWDSIKSGTIRVWNAIVEWVKALPGKIADFFLNWTIVGRVIKHWDELKAGVIQKGGELLAWVRDLPGRITNSLGSLRDLLVDKGRDLIRGLVSGVKAMGGWLRSELMSFAASMIPGPIADALGIHSPSRVLADKVGRWIPPGIVRGIDKTKGLVGRAMRALVPVPDVPAFGGMGAPAMAGASPYGVTAPAASGATVHIEHWHAAENGTPDDNARALEWAAKGRG